MLLVAREVGVGEGWRRRKEVARKDAAPEKSARIGVTMRPPPMPSSPDRKPATPPDGAMV
eukprot:2285383-Rhodomonas_salina.1